MRFLCFGKPHKADGWANVTQQIAEDNQRQLEYWRSHEAIYGNTLAISINGAIPEWFGKDEGSYWYTCPEGHCHKKTAIAWADVPAHLKRHD